jgi:hypothetical protein
MGEAGFRVQGNYDRVQEAGFRNCERVQGARWLFR